MTSPLRRPILGPFALALAAALVVASAAQAAAWAQGYSRQAQQVLIRARSAAGGAGWNYLRGWHEAGTDGAARYELWLDPLRYGMRLERREAGGRAVEGFNGLGAWRITPAGVATGTGEGPAVAQARAAAFFGVRAFYFPGRFDAAGRYLGLRTAGGRSFEVVEVKPWGGTARELWFDRRTGLLARMVERPVERTGATAVTTELSDYRKVGPVRVAFRAVTDDGTPGGRHERVVESLTFTPADRTMFSLPRLP